MSTKEKFFIDFIKKYGKKLGTYCKKAHMDLTHKDHYELHVLTRAWKHKTHSG